MRQYDVIIIGSGFAGSIMAMILRRLGHIVLILDKNKHPRFAIGESSTPLANLLLEEIAAKYDLADLATFSKWGTWQAAHPEIACGLKRGFTFYKHDFGRAVDFGDRTQQLLVAASPHDRIADTHWYRPDFDAHMVKQAQALGAELIEQAQFKLTEHNDHWLVTSGAFAAEAKFLIDASGPRGCLFQHFEFQEKQTLETEALFAHFRNVARIDAQDSELPFPVDDAAVHHIFEGGWIWVLRFNNGLTSAGASLTRGLARELRIEDGAPAWARLLERLPTLRGQFANATPVTNFFHQSKIAFRSPKAAGKNWAMLPSAAGFADPLFSTGFVLTLLGISRLAALFPKNDLAAYQVSTFEELDRAARLVSLAFKSFNDFSKFIQIARIYFANAIWSETLRRLGRTPPGFLSVEAPLDRIDLAGLLDQSRRNWHPARAEDLFGNAWKIPASADEIQRLLQRCGF